MSSHHVEPAADLRQLASFYRQMFIALTNEGFSEQQALILLGQMMAAFRLGGDGE